MKSCCSQACRRLCQIDAIRNELLAQGIDAEMGKTGRYRLRHPVRIMPYDQLIGEFRPEANRGELYLGPVPTRKHMPRIKELERIGVAERAAWVSQFGKPQRRLVRWGRASWIAEAHIGRYPPSRAMPESQVQLVTGQIHKAFACIMVMAKGRAPHISRQGNIVHILVE